MAATAIVLDLDGTLWDSRPLFAGVLSREVDVSYSEALSRLERGESIVRVAKSYGVSRNRFTRAAVAMLPDTFLFDGAIEAIDQLRANGVPAGVFTSLPGAIAHPLLEATGLDTRFVAVSHAGNAPRKPNPRGILQVLAAMGQEPSTNVFYVGDQPTDSLTAARAGVLFAWASYGYCEDVPDYVETVLTEPMGLTRL